MSKKLTRLTPPPPRNDVQGNIKERRVNLSIDVPESVKWEFKRLSVEKRMKQRDLFMLMFKQFIQSQKEE